MKKKKFYGKVAALLAVLLLSTGCGTEKTDQPATVSENVPEPTEQAEHTEDPAALPDGTYLALFESDNSMFHVNEVCEGRGTLTVSGGRMSMHLVMPSKNVVNLFYGLAEDAKKDDAELIEPATEEVTYPDGMTEEVYAFDIPVPYLDETFDLALIGKKGKWYDHKVSVSDPVPENDKAQGQNADFPTEDGEYRIEVELEGGSGRASITSPALLTVSGGKMTLRVEWSSPHYDYMLLDGKKYEPVNTEGNSVFEIPVEDIEKPLPVIADTTAMSVPHEIEYTIVFKGIQGGSSSSGTGEFDTEYAKLFGIEKLEGGCLSVTTEDGRQIVSVPEGGAVPAGLGEDVIVLKQPVSHIYLAASAAADMLDSIGATEAIAFSATEKDAWHIEAMRRGMEKGNIRYAGKYGNPDYELLLSGGCTLAVENMMISHAPETIDKLEEIGIPVIIDHSSYESDPLGRMEWVKFYGAILGRYEEAVAVFEEQKAKTVNLPDTGKTVAFFYLRNDGAAVVRRSDDYVPAMIKTAGGDYILSDVYGDSHLSTSALQMEEFYARAKDADYIVYNGTTTGEIHSIGELLEKSSLMEDFKAVKEGHVYAVSKDMYQHTMSLGTVIADLHNMMTDAPDEELVFLEHLY